MPIEAAQIERQALEGIYERYSPALFRYAFRLLGDQDLAEECVSETFSRYLHSLRNGSRGQIENIQAYLYRVAHNLIMDHYRRKPPPLVQLEPGHQLDQRHEPSHALIEQMERERVRQALLRLTSEQRQVILLRFLEDWSHEQIAALLGKTAEATRALQHRALLSLRRLLIEKEEEDAHDPRL